MRTPDPQDARQALLDSLTVERFTPVSVTIGRLRREKAEAEVAAMIIAGHAAEEGRAQRARHLRVVKEAS